jgi:hypothetical protein
VGQLIKFLPAGGGVTQVQVVALSRSASRIGFSVSASHERVEGSTIIQEQTKVAADAVLMGTEVAFEMAVSFQSTMSQPGYLVPGDPKASLCRGKLRKK